MIKPVRLPGRKRAPNVFIAPPSKVRPARASAAAPEQNAELDLDPDLFMPIAVQPGRDNEASQRSIGHPVDPASKTLRAYEETNNKNLNLEHVLHNSRLVQDKLRDELGVADKKARDLEIECTWLRDVAAAAEQRRAADDKTKSELRAEIASYRAHFAELQKHTEQRDAELQQARNETNSYAERLFAADSRLAQLEGEVQAAQQKISQAAEERATVQPALEEAHAGLAHSVRRLMETERAHAATQARLTDVEASLAEAQDNHIKLSEKLDETNHRHCEEMIAQTSQFEIFRAQANIIETQLEEARQTLASRTDEIRSFERHVSEFIAKYEDTSARFEQATVALAERDARIKDLEQSNATLQEQYQLLSDMSAAREEAHNNAAQKGREHAELAALLETQFATARSQYTSELEQMWTQLKSAELERSMTEGALEASRKDVERLLHDIAVLQKQRPLAPPQRRVIVHPAAARAA
jgi:chromosome segregation ATPase